MRTFTFYSLRFVCLIALVLPLRQLPAQDIHFSQFANSPINLNPALAGIFGGELRAVGNYRHQWARVPVPYTTFGLSADRKFFHNPTRFDQFFSAGLRMFHDKQGSLGLTSVQFSIPLSFTMPIAQNKRHFLTLGFAPGYGSRYFNNSELTFDEQFVDCFFDPTAAITENLSSNRLQYVDLSGGVNWRMQGKLRSRSRLDVGVALHHLNRPHHDFWSESVVGGGQVRLASRVATYGLGMLQLTNRFDAIGQVQYQRQGGYRELVYGVGGRLHVNTMPYNEFAIQGNVSFRHRYNDAIIAQLEGHWRTWTLAFSYDFNTSANASQLTNGRGGPEVAIIWRMYKVKPLPFFKTCPIM